MPARRSRGDGGLSWDNARIHLHMHGLTPEHIAEIITRRGGRTPPL
jgi:hypothetical protein